MSGSESPQFHGDAIDALDETLPNSRIVTFDGHGHAAMNTASERFVEEVLGPSANRTDGR